jgi:hypothetical protein
MNNKNNNGASFERNNIKNLDIFPSPTVKNSIDRPSKS